MRSIATIAAGLCLVAAPCLAQQRPLVTEDPETVGEGQVLLEAGLDYARETTYPVSGLTGNLLRMPTVGVSIGVSPIAEIQVDGGLFTRLRISERASAPVPSSLDPAATETSSLDDLAVGVKIRLVPEGTSRPGLGVRFTTRLPTSSAESGLGLGTTDFYASLLAAKTVESVRVVLNLGTGALGDPIRGGRHNNVLTYGLSFARAATQATEVVGEINGRANLSGDVPPPGTDSRSLFRIGARHTRGTLRADAAFVLGITTDDPRIGFTGGLTYVFNAFRLP